ncbi:MAG: 3-isopropylmalate dehydratase small subunit [Verrucomicrobiaceae bacterium]|nr:3-isopropylmalate dehydratase small subunit [Verrucomicrobiaceae bacterium]
MALEKITKVTGSAAYVPGNDIDTDRIIPARFMKCVTFDGLGEYLFHDVRKDENGVDRDHPLNDERFSSASILISNANFGCGSSREHAPQALYRYGFRAVIAESFADIFFGNCTTLGMPCVVAKAEDVRALAAVVEANPAAEVTIDVVGNRVLSEGIDFAVKIPQAAHDALVAGQWDPIAELQEGDSEVAQRVAALGYLPAGK